MSPGRQNGPAHAVELAAEEDTLLKVRASVATAHEPPPPPTSGPLRPSKHHTDMLKLVACVL